MFCNDSQMDECDLVRPGAETVTRTTSPGVLFVPAHDCGRHRWLIWAHHLPCFTFVSNYFLDKMI